LALTYQQDLKIQTNKLKRTLLSIYDKIKRDVSIDIPNFGHISWSEVQRIYKTEIDDAIRSAVAEIYTIAARKTVTADIKLSFFLTQTDMNEIQQITQRYQSWYITALNREVVNRTAYAYDPTTLLMLQPSDLQLREGFIGRLLGSIQSETTAAAVISKARQVVLSQAHTNRQRRNIGRSQFLSSRNAAIQRQPGRQTYSEPQIIWTTGGTERTCPICSQYEGRSFAIDDFDMPRPVEDTHPNCQCELVLVGAEDFGDFESEEQQLFM